MMIMMVMMLFVMMNSVMTVTHTTPAKICMLAVPCRPQNENGNDDDADCNDDIVMTVTHTTLAEICMLAAPLQTWT